MVETPHDLVNRLSNLHRFYEILDLLSQRIGGARILGQCTAKSCWPARGVYFFFEDSENRSDSGMRARVVRVGTHALTAESNTTLWGRLSQHRGVARSGSGNHRGSVFRLLVGAAIINRDGVCIPTWGIGQTIKAASERKSISVIDIRNDERPIEESVSQVIGHMRVLWVEIPDAPGPQSLRGLIERNSIALLSNYRKSTLDAESKNWLGHFCDRKSVRESGLWNVNHVDENYDPDFLRLFETLAAAMPI